MFTRLIPELPNPSQQAVYLLHFDEPFEGQYDKAKPKRRQQVQHYCGYTAHNLERRLSEHGTAAGARLLQVLRERGIGWTLARCWPGRGRDLEHQLKNSHKLSLYCPVCRGVDAREA